MQPLRRPSLAWRAAVPAVAAALAALSIALAPARAETVASAAATLYAAGDYARAEDQAREADSADGWALAARALMARALLAESKREIIRLSREAERCAAEALALDPGHVEGNLQYAAAIGVRARHTSGVIAHLKGLAKASKRHMETAYDIDPGNPWVMSMFGGWHMEVVRRGGAHVYGASLDEGVDWFQRALAADPDNIVIAYNYAEALAKSGEPSLRDEFDRVLTVVRNAEPEDAFAAALKARVQTLEILASAGAGREA